MLKVQEVPEGQGSLGGHVALEQRLRAHVLKVARNRHRRAQPSENRAVAEYIAHELEGMGFRVDWQGPLDNVVALPKTSAGRSDDNERPALVAAHYDSVPFSPGADDNASAVAVLLEAARAAARTGANIGFVAFNAEEEGLMGSRDFVKSSSITPRVVHVLEMVGYTDRRPGGQRRPVYLPIRMPDVGDFLGVIANRNSAAEVERVRAAARGISVGPRLLTLDTRFGVERLLFDLLRSDHVPFWKRGIPALMWTDTANFRNPNYHRGSDTPDTLDYAFMTRVCLLLCASIDVALPVA